VVVALQSRRTEDGEKLMVAVVLFRCPSRSTGVGGRGGGSYGATSLEGEATQRHEAVGAGATRRGFDAQRKTGNGGRSTRMTSQQAERAAELHLVRAEVAHKGCGQAQRPYEWLRKHAGSARTGAVRSKRVSSCASRSVRPAML
jgi:hypothetical protein